VLDESIAPGEIEYAPDVRQLTPLRLRGEASLIVEHRGPKEFVDDIRLRAAFEGRFEMLCARCVEPVEEDLVGNFDLIFRPGGVDNEPGEHAITEDETEIGYYEDSGLLLEDAVREQVLLALPGRVLCRQDCRGLCPQCGANRNESIDGEASCKCEEQPVDRRWNALAGLAVDKS
jgi:uncharacterized protein